LADKIGGNRNRGGRSETREGLRDAESRRSVLTALKTSLRSKPATGYRVGTITEDDKYGGDAT
jgi:hypothetical protein